MLFRPSHLTLVTTHRCTAACDNCCFSCSPTVADAIPIARIESLIDETRDLPSIERVSFTGGECFLLGKNLDRLIARASAFGLRTKCVTNGYWAVNRDAAGRRVAELVRAGLDELALSTGTLHSTFVPIERVAEGARAAALAGLRVQIVVETFDQASFSKYDVAQLPSIRALVDDGRIVLVEDPWIPNVRGDGRLKPTHACVSHDVRALANGRCASILDTISITPSLQLMVCCGFPMEGLPELSLGSVAKTSMRDVIARASDNLLMMWLHVDGPHEMLAFVRRHEPSYVVPTDHVSICQTCHHLQRDPVALRTLREHAQQAEERIVRLYLASQVIKAGGSVVAPEAGAG